MEKAVFTLIFEGFHGRREQNKQIYRRDSFMFWVHRKKIPFFGLGRCMMGNLTVAKKCEWETWDQVLKSLTIHAGRVVMKMWSSSISTNWELARNANSRPPPQTSWFRSSGGGPSNLGFHKPSWPFWCVLGFGNCSKMFGLLLWTQATVAVFVLTVEHLPQTSWGTLYFEVNLPR